MFLFVVGKNAMQAFDVVVHMVFRTYVFYFKMGALITVIGVQCDIESPIYEVKTYARKTSEVATLKLSLRPFETIIPQCYNKIFYFYI